MREHVLARHSLRDLLGSASRDVVAHGRLWLSILNEGEPRGTRLPTSGMAFMPATTAPMAADAPTLSGADEDAIRVKWTLPQGVLKAGSFAYVSLQAAGTSKWLRVDAASGKLDDPEALPATAATECVVKNIDPKLSYQAKVRLGNAGGWGPDSKISKSFRLADHVPGAPAAPVAEPLDGTSMRVHLTLPPSLPGSPPPQNINLKLSTDQKVWKSVDSTTSSLVVDGTGKSYPPTVSVVDVKGLSFLKTYYVKTSVKNACGWGPDSTVLRIKDFTPRAPATPVVEVVDETSVRVHFKLPPKLPGELPMTFVYVVAEVGSSGAIKSVDSKTSTLVASGAGLAYGAAASVADVKGLSPGESYTFQVVARNACGWGGYSKGASVQLPSADVECTGGRTVEEKNAELRKRAVDVESEEVAGRTASRIPAAKRAKKE